MRFRHELARNAIRSSIPAAARRRLHGEILEALLAADADPADIVHHAEAAGAEDVVAEYALVAARRAAALESNREAYSHYHRAADFVDRLAPAEQAAVLEELATPPTPSAGSTRRSRRWSARSRLYARARRPEARRPLHARRLALPLVRRQRRRSAAKATEAVEILAPLGESVELAARVQRRLAAGDARGRDRRRRSSGASVRSSWRPGSATTTSACTR